MINHHLMEPFATTYRRSALYGEDHLVVDEIVRESRTMTYRVGASLVSIGTRLMRGDETPSTSRAA